MKTIDVVALGTCYVDTNTYDYPFDSRGIPTQTELVGGSYEITPGGSAVNFCRQLTTLGLGTAFVGMAGTDVNGDVLAQLLAQQQIQSALIQRPDLQTNVSFNMTSPAGEHIMLVAGTANAALNPDDVLPKLAQLMPDSRLLYLGGCFKLTAFKDAFVQIAERAKEASVQLVVDHGRVPAGLDKAMLDAVRQLVLRADYYLPSRDEFCLLWDVQDIADGLAKLQALAPQLTVVVKDGANGALYRHGGALQRALPEQVAKVQNATGAGDTFNAGFITAMLQGRSLADATTFGCRVAATHIQGKPLPRLADQ